MGLFGSRKFVILLRFQKTRQMQIAPELNFHQKNGKVQHFCVFFPKNLDPIRCFVVFCGQNLYKYEAAQNWRSALYFVLDFWP